MSEKHCSDDSKQNHQAIWFGNIAERLGLAGQVLQSDFEAVFNAQRRG